MSKLTSELLEAFRAADLRLTPQRYAVLEFLASHRVHATAEEICSAVNRTDQLASRATVYNNLRALSRAGLVREVLDEGNSARFDATLCPHHHFICDLCGAIEDIAWFEVQAPAGMQGLDGVAVRRYEVVFHGVCRNCRNSKSGRGDT